MSDKQLTTAEVAERYGVTTMTVIRWIRAGLFQGARRVGPGRRGIWLIPESDLEGFVPPSKRD